MVGINSPDQHSNSLVTQQIVMQREKIVFGGNRKHCKDTQLLCDVNSACVTVRKQTASQAMF